MRVLRTGLRLDSIVLLSDSQLENTSENDKGTIQQEIPCFHGSFAAACQVANLSRCLCGSSIQWLTVKRKVKSQAYANELGGLPNTAAAADIKQQATMIEKRLAWGARDYNCELRGGKLKRAYHDQLCET